MGQMKTHRTESKQVRTTSLTTYLHNIRMPCPLSAISAFPDDGVIIGTGGGGKKGSTGAGRHLEPLHTCYRFYLHLKHLLVRMVPEWRSTMD